MIDKKSWKEFRNIGLLFVVNQFLNFFGWAIVFKFDEKDNIVEVYPARTKFRGFPGSVTTDGYKRVSKYLAENSVELDKEINQ